MGAFDFGSAMRGGVEGLLSGLPQGAEFVRALRTAAAQQDELAERKRQFDIEQGMRQATSDRQGQQQGFENQMQLNTAGAQPVSGSGTYNMPMSPAPSLPGGAQLPGVPAGGGVTAGGPSQVPVGSGDNVVTPPGTSSKYRLPSQDERNQAELGRKVSEAKAVEGAKRFNLALPERLGEILGIPHGSTVTVEHAPTAEDYSSMAGQINRANTPEKPDKPQKTPGHWATNEETGAVSYIEPGDDGKLNVSSTGPGVGKTRAPKTEGDKPPSPAQLRTVRSKYDSTLADSRKQLEKDLKDGALSGEGVRQAYVDHVSRMQDAQKAYESELGTVLGKDVGHNDWADREMDQLSRGGQQTPTGTQNNTPAAGSGANSKSAAPKQGSQAQEKQLTDPQVATKYLKQAGGDKAKARQLAAADGWKF